MKQAACMRVQANLRSWYAFLDCLRLQVRCPGFNHYQAWFSQVCHVTALAHAHAVKRHNTAGSSVCSRAVAGELCMLSPAVLLPLLSSSAVRCMLLLPFASA
jgi:hypothetical protein